MTFVTFTAFLTCIPNSGGKTFQKVPNDKNRSAAYLFKWSSSYSKTYLQKKGDVGTIFIYKHKIYVLWQKTLGSIRVINQISIWTKGQNVILHNNNTIYNVNPVLYLWRIRFIPASIIAFLLEARIILYIYSVLGKVTFKSNALQYCVTL